MTAQSFDAHERNAPADPAGLDAAIEAVVAIYLERNGFPTDLEVKPTYVLAYATAAVRAAAPHIRRAALREAADELKAAAEAYATKWAKVGTAWDVGYVRGVERAVGDIRKRAEQS